MPDARRLVVLFLVSEPTGSPALAVHAMVARFLDRDRVDVHVLYERLADAEPYASAGSPVRLFPADAHLRPADFGPRGGSVATQIRATLALVRGLADAVRYVRRNHVDVVYCDGRNRNIPYGYALARLAGAKCVVGFHSKYGDWLIPPSRFAIEHADAVVAVSDWTARSVADGGVSRDRVHTVLNGIDTDAWDPAEADPGRVRRELGIAPDVPLIVCVAQLVSWKRQRLLVEAFGRLLSSGTPATLMLVGDVQHPELDEEGVTYLERVRERIVAVGAEGHVVLAGRRSDVRDVLAAADVVSLPSVDDPAPLAVIEAMAMGKPVVVANAGGAPELLDGGRVGVIVPPDDPEALAEALGELLADPVRREQLGVAARAHVLERLTARRVADEVEAVCRWAILDSNQGPPPYQSGALTN